MRSKVLILAGALALLGRPALAQAVSGAATFNGNCSACHQTTGKGIPGAFPALAGDAFVTGDPHKVIVTLLNGRGGMPSFRNDLNNAQIAAAISYIRSSWGNMAPPVAPGDVAKLRGSGGSEHPGDSLQSH